MIKAKWRVIVATMLPDCWHLRSKTDHTAVTCESAVFYKNVSKLTKKTVSKVVSKKSLFYCKINDFMILLTC